MWLASKTAKGPAGHNPVTRVVRKNIQLEPIHPTNKGSIESISVARVPHSRTTPFCQEPLPEFQNLGLLIARKWLASGWDGRPVVIVIVKKNIYLWFLESLVSSWYCEVRTWTCSPHLEVFLEKDVTSRWECRWWTVDSFGELFKHSWKSFIKYTKYGKMWCYERRPSWNTIPQLSSGWGCRTRRLVWVRSVLQVADLALGTGAETEKHLAK